jgi:hypothetical protein
MAKKTKAEKAKKDKKGAKGGKKKGSRLEPRAVTTGKGAGPAEVGADLVAMFNRGEFAAIEEKWWSPKITSVEGVGVAMAWEGRKAVVAKNKGWMETNAIRSARAEGPFVGASGFAVKFWMDVEEKTSGKRTEMEEVGVYEVKNGKIVREEFMYGTMKTPGGSKAELAPIGG